MNQLDNIKKFNPDNYDESDSEDEYDTDSEISFSDLEYESLDKSEINSKNCLSLLNQNNKLKNKFKKYIEKTNKQIKKLDNEKNILINKNTNLSQTIEVLFAKNYELINLNRRLIKSFESKNTFIMSMFGTFLTSSLFGLACYYWKFRQ
jgi:hypothetical protein